MAESLAVTLHAMAEESANGQSAAVDIGTRRTAARLVLRVLSSAAAGLSVTVQTTDESSAGPWHTVATFPTQNAAGAAELYVGKLLQYVRVGWTRTANVEFSVVGEAHTLYCEPWQIKAAADVLNGQSDSDKAEACIDASGEAESYIASGYTMPLSAWPAEMIRKVGLLAAWNLVHKRGIRADGADELVLTERDHAISWFKQIRSGSLRPPGIIDSTPETYEGGGVVVSSAARRGW